MTPLKLRTEPPPPESWLKTERVVVYELNGKKWRCSEREWERFIGTFEKKRYSSVLDMVRDNSDDPTFVKALERRIAKNDAAEVSERQRKEKKRA
jgi:hypothetical protein